MSQHAPPAVTVLIGCWNNGRTLRAAIDSILTQTWRDLEVIVVDDGSTDDTPELVRAVQSQDARVRYLPLEHMGISRSLNEGLRSARGELVAFQDADDWSLPTRLERQVAVHASHPDAVVVGSRMYEVDQVGRRLAPRTRFAPEEVNEVLMRFNPIPNSCAMVRRDAALRLGGFDPRYRYAMDYDLWLRLAERGTIITLDEPLAVRRMGSANVAARHERAQTWEAIRIRIAAIRRRHAGPAQAGALAVPALALLTPLWLKRAVRRARGQAV